MYKKWPYLTMFFSYVQFKTSATDRKLGGAGVNMDFAITLNTNKALFIKIMKLYLYFYIHCPCYVSEIKFSGNDCIEKNRRNSII